MKTSKDIIRELEELALATRLKRLSDRLMGDVGKIYKEQKIDFEPRWFTMLYILNQQKTLSIIEIADSLKLSHPAVVQFADQMQIQKLITTKKDKKDGRKRMIELTKKGEETFEKLKPILTQIEKATRELITQTDQDLLYIIDKIEKQLDKTSIYERVKLGLKSAVFDEVEIISYHPRLKKYFKKLNEEWLQEYFTIEKDDVRVLNNPEKEIIQKGGEIFFAVLRENVVGTITLQSHGNKIFELCKMAVTKEQRENSIGAKLIQHLVASAKRKKAKQIYLETNRKLHAAIHLYEKFGFKMDGVMKDSKYKRSTNKMTLIVN